MSAGGSRNWMVTNLTTPPENEREAVVLFDGVCSLCNGVVDFIIRRDRQKRFRFASLQSPTGRRLAEECGLAADALSTLVLMEGGRCYTHSEAVLRIVRHLQFPWRLACGFRVAPRYVRDAAYRVVARHRYRWFGRRETCRVATAAERERFLE